MIPVTAAPISLTDYVGRRYKFVFNEPGDLEELKKKEFTEQDLYHLAYNYSTGQRYVLTSINPVVFEELELGLGPDGNKGEKGGLGKKGERGPRGHIGHQGDKGPPGKPGSKGPIGETGPAGDRGSEGPMGLTGPVGPRGIDGLQGEQGDMGPKGEPGEPGMIGSRGLQGELGKTGPIGLRGHRGAAGAKGEKGLPGLTGNQGHAGYEGLPGETGDAGEVGDVGPKGKAGEVGDEGHVGEIGEPGLEGSKGAPGELNWSCLDAKHKRLVGTVKEFTSQLGDDLPRYHATTTNLAKLSLKGVVSITTRSSNLITVSSSESADTNSRTDITSSRAVSVKSKGANKLSVLGSSDITVISPIKRSYLTASSSKITLSVLSNISVVASNRLTIQKFCMLSSGSVYGMNEEITAAIGNKAEKGIVYAKKLVTDSTGIADDVFINTFARVGDIIGINEKGYAVNSGVLYGVVSNSSSVSMPMESRRSKKIITLGTTIAKVRANVAPGDYLNIEGKVSLVPTGISVIETVTEYNPAKGFGYSRVLVKKLS